MADSPRERHRQAVSRNRRTMDRLLDRTILRPLQRVWDRGTGRLHRELSKAARRAQRRATPSDLAEFHGHATRILADILASVGDQLVESTGPVLTESVRGVAGYMGAMRQLPGPLDDEATVAMITSTHRLNLERMRLQTAASLAPNINARIGEVLASSRFDESTLADIADAVGDVADQQWWQVERVVRTETAHAFNTGQVEAIFVLEEEMPDIMKRWTELVDDVTGQPLDNRVAGDSIAMHGQIAKPADMFVMPSAPTAPTRMVGSSWPYPPNRPNDRAVVTPWRKGWGVPGWLMQNGSKVTLR